MTDTRTWLEICEGHLSKAKRDEIAEPHQLNRRAIRKWQWRVFRARHHTVAAVLIGGTLGVSISLAMSAVYDTLG